jgi:pilus assembly protein Flp/PilA
LRLGICQAASGLLRFPQRGQILMKYLTQAVVSFLKREDGPTAVEYAVMLALIIVVCIAAITALGSNANTTFTSVSNVVGATGS